MEGYETGYTKNRVGWCGLASFCLEWELVMDSSKRFNPLNAELYPISHLLALLGAHPILHVNRIRVNELFGFINRVNILSN
jgi:hypothetical protein